MIGQQPRSRHNAIGGSGNMRPRIRHKWIRAGLFSLAATISAGGAAQAGAISAGGGYKPGPGHPQYYYILTATLNAPTMTGTDSFGNGNSITFYNLPGVDINSTTNAPPTNIPGGIQWGYPTVVPTSASMPRPPYASDVTWNFVGTHVYSVASGGSSISLGQFTILTTFDFPTPPFQNGNDVIDYSYTYSFNGMAESGSGMF